MKGRQSRQWLRRVGLARSRVCFLSPKQQTPLDKDIAAVPPPFRLPKKEGSEAGVPRHVRTTHISEVLAGTAQGLMEINPVYHISSVTLAIRSVDGVRTAVMLPAGAVVRLVAGPLEGTVTVDVTWEGKVLMMAMMSHHKER